MKPRTPDHCTECGQQISFWRIIGSRDEKWCPVDPSSDPSTGRIRKVPVPVDGRMVVHARFLSRVERVEARAQGELLFTPHSDTCSARKPLNPRPRQISLPIPDTAGPPARHRARGRR